MSEATAELEQIVAGKDVPRCWSCGQQVKTHRAAKGFSTSTCCMAVGIVDADGGMARRMKRDELAKFEKFRETQPDAVKRGRDLIMKKGFFG